MRQNYPLAYNPDAKLVLKLDEAPKLSALHRVAMGEGCVTGFFFADAVAALGDFERASRHLAALIKVGAVRCTTVRLGFSTHDFYAVA